MEKEAELVPTGKEDCGQPRQLSESQKMGMEGTAKSMGLGLTVPVRSFDCVR